MRIKGSGVYTDATGKNRRILGIGELSDDKKLLELKVSGNISFDDISCEEINVSGKCDGGSINAQNLKISGGLLFNDISCEEANISGKCEGKSISAKNFSASGKVKVDSLTIEENLSLSGKPQIDSMTADEVCIASRDGFIGKIVCHKVRILDNVYTFNEGFFVKNFIENVSFKDKIFSRVQIKSIEADIVELENCKVDVIRCQDASIGSNCSIEKLFVAGECKVADDSTVNETIHI